MGVKQFCSAGLRSLTSIIEYDTPKIVHIKNKKVGVLNRIVQLAIILYIIVWGIILKKGYQKTGPITGTITTKLKGASFYNGSHGDFSVNCEGLGEVERTFDVGDYVIPPQEPNAFFVMTNLWRTCNQTQRHCPESPKVYNSNCELDEGTDFNLGCVDPYDNSTGYVFEGGNGPTTGRCIEVAPGEGRCEIRGWCDAEEENETITDKGPKIDASNFTVLIKNVIEFPDIQLNMRKRNIKETNNATFLKTCRFNEATEEHLYCPIFSLGQIVDMIKPTKRVPWKQDFRNLSTRGAVVGLEITWNCDHLEWNLDNCNPTYVAKRFDDPNAKISQGFNFRYAHYYYEGGVQKRILTKAYGILFKVELHGTGGRFDFFTLILKIGSMIALLGIASIVCDVLVLYILKRRDYYRDNKYLNVNDPIHDYEVITHKDTEEMPITHNVTEKKDSY